MSFKQEFQIMKNEKVLLESKVEELDQRNENLRADLKEAMISLQKFEVSVLMILRWKRTQRVCWELTWAK